MSAARHNTRPRSGPGVFFHAGHAATAASIASRTSAAVASGYSAITSLVSAGLMFLLIVVEAGRYHLPLTYEPVFMRAS